MLDRLKETEFYQELATVMKTNSTMLTGFAAVLIMVSGVAVVDHTERWWVPVVSLTVFSLVVFLFMNFRVIIKAIGSTVATVMLSSFAFTGGSLADRFGLGGLVWVGMIDLGAVFRYLGVVLRVPVRQVQVGAYYVGPVRVLLCRLHSDSGVSSGRVVRPGWCGPGVCDVHCWLHGVR